jgi:thioredoxin 1
MRIATIAVLFMALLMSGGLSADERAAEPMPFEQSRFDALLAEGRPVLVDVWASWCPTCRRQGRVLQELLAEEAFSEVVWLKVDFDTQKDIVRAFEAPRQSVLIMFAGGAEQARSIAETDSGRIRELVLSGLD